MNIKTVTVAFVAIMVGAVIFGAMIPIFQELTDNSGDPITKTNVGTGHTFKEMVPGDVLECKSIYSDSSRTDTWTLNGETVLNEGITGFTWDWGLISDVYFMQVNASGNSAIGTGQTITSSPGTVNYYSGANSTDPNKTYTWTMETDGTITFDAMFGDNPGTVVTFSPTWAYVVSTVEKGAYMSAQVTTNPYYASENSKDVILAGNYTTGDLDTGYYYGKDGVLTIVNTSYTGTVNFAQTKTDGTTDIYDTLLTVSVTDGNDTESFSPYRALVPYQVTGHASSGSVYTVFGILPLAVAIGLLLGAIGFFISKRF